MPDDDVLERFYDAPSYFDTRTIDASESWAQRACEILSVLPQPPLAVLDVGAGEGHLVRALRDAGIDAHGVDPSAAARATALRDRQVALSASIDDVRAAPFDAVVMLHSLEHVADPPAMLRRLREVLRPGGAMYIEVPHAGSADMRLPRSRQWILDLPAHLHHFTPSTLTRLVEEAGFSVIKTQLFNALPVEAALDRRRRRRETGTANDAPGQASGPASAAVPVARAGWRRVATMLRSYLPGSKFWIVVQLQRSC